MSDPEPLNVVHVLHHLRVGGMENGLVNLINALPRKRFAHTVICIEDYSDFRQRIARDDVAVHAMHRSRIGVWRLRWRLWRLLRRIRPDIVHTRNLSGLDALLPARMAGARTLHSEHGFDVDNLQGRARKHVWLRRLHAPLVHRYVTVSAHLARLATQVWGVDARRVRHICNGVDTRRFVPSDPPRRDRLPAAWSAPGIVVVGTVGRLQAVKDQATLLRAFAAARSAHAELARDLRLLIVGDGPERAALQAEADALGLGDAIVLAGVQHDVLPWFQAMDLFVLPSLMEGISNTVLEAMACGLPTLTTGVGGNVELVEEGVTGATFAVGDVDALALMIGHYARDARLRHEQGAAARQRAQRQFSLDAMVSGYQRAYEEL